MYTKFIYTLCPVTVGITGFVPAFIYFTKYLFCDISRYHKYYTVLNNAYYILLCLDTSIYSMVY